MKDRENIIPLRNLANSVGYGLFEGNDRDMAEDREISGFGDKREIEEGKEEKALPRVLQFISFKE